MQAKQKITNVDITKESQNIISFCTGLRGIERGIEENNPHIRTVAHVEIEAFICENLASEMEKGLLAPAPIWTNLKTFDAYPFRDRIHGITGGYPCQPFSTAGKQQGAKDPRHLWPYIARHIQAIRPVWCFFENVANHLNIGFETVHSELSAMGYNVEAGIFSAEEVGATHQRKRLFVLAISKEYLAYAKSQRAGSGGNEQAINNGYRQHLEGAESGCNIEYYGESEMGNSSGKGLSISRFGTIGEFPKENINGLHNRLEFTSEVMDNTTCGNELHVSREFGEISQKLSIISYNMFPAPPGEQQHVWEEPRITKPGLGCSAHGYNFREDILRAYGNGVVRQTASWAWKVLLTKQGL